MSRHHSHLNTAKTILLFYDGQIPFSQEIKKFFSNNKKYGSKDRRQIRSLCYCYFRTVLILDNNLSIEDKILHGYFLCTSATSLFLEQLKPEWVPLIELTAKEKCIQLGLQVERIFPNLNSVEESIDKIGFSFSHFIQPDLFLRIRPNHEQNVKNKLVKAEIDYIFIDTHCIALNNTTKIEEVLKINKELVIQDYASQKVGDMFDVVRSHYSESNDKLKVWDCCAASGGKTILAVDKLEPIDIALSDIRKNILHNLKNRMRQAQITEYKYDQVDLTDAESITNFDEFDLIIADVPCSGSGTWSRTPERLLYFKKTEIEHYTKLQKTITENIQAKLKPGAFLLYITCSVYKQENSDIVNNLVANFGLEHIKSEVYKGYQYKGDSMFASLLRKQ